MRRTDIEGLDATRTWWVLALAAPERDWPPVPGCRRGARYLVDTEALAARRDEFGAFDDRLSCLNWLLAHRAELHRALPGADVRPVRLDRWLLGMD